MTGFDYQPRLTDGVVTLRPLLATDWPALYAVAGDPAIWAQHPATERWTETSFRTFFDLALASGGTLVIEEEATGAMIGSSRYDLSRAGPGEIEIGWTFLARSRWGGATNARVKRLMLDHALATFDRVVFLIGEGNLRSRRATEKIGGVLTSRALEAIVEGRPTRHVVYAIDRAAFLAWPH